MTQQLTISATEANRSFSALLRQVALGKSVTVTSHGRPVAVIAPAEDADAEGREKRAKALAALRKHWATVEPIMVGPWTRDDLYERD